METWSLTHCLLVFPNKYMGPSLWLHLNSTGLHFLSPRWVVSRIILIAISTQAAFLPIYRYTNMYQFQVFWCQWCKTNQYKSSFLYHILCHPQEKDFSALSVPFVPTTFKTSFSISTQNSSVLSFRTFEKNEVFRFQWGSTINTVDTEDSYVTHLCEDRNITLKHKKVLCWLQIWG